MSAVGAMKRPAPAGGELPAAAKARVAKAPAAAKAPISKAPVAKAPVAKAPVAQAPVAKAPAQPAPQEPQAANGGGSPTAESAKPARADSWKEFESADPLYALFGEVANYKVLGADGVFHPDRLDKYLDKLMVHKVAKKPKDWVEVWAAMDIPVTNQSIVLEPILKKGLEVAPHTLGKILAELLKGHRVKTKTIEESVQGAFNGRADTHGTLREFLFLIFPKGPQSEWGWSRVGWSWQEWWKITENCHNALEKSSAFDSLGALLDKIEAEGKMTLVKQSMPWNEKRLGLARSLLLKFGEIEDENDLLACIDSTLR